MTERPRGDLQRDESSLVIGPSSLRCVDGCLEVTVAEVGVPVPRRLTGRVRLEPLVTNDVVMHLDAAGRHRWRPIAPLARITVDFLAPRLSWTGTAYLDTNNGDEPLEQAFATWDWARVHAEGATTILYDVTNRDGSRVSLARRFDRAGTMTLCEPPPLRRLAPSHWRMARHIRAVEAAPAHVVRTLEDTPFYARSLVRTDLGDGPVLALHESLSLIRVANPVIRCMLPFRMPRLKHLSPATSL